MTIALIFQTFGSSIFKSWYLSVFFCSLMGMFWSPEYFIFIIYASYTATSARRSQPGHSAFYIDFLYLTHRACSLAAHKRISVSRLHPPRFSHSHLFPSSGSLFFSRTAREELSPSIRPGVVFYSPACFEHL